MLYSPLMTDLVPFALAVLALLATPGPTNTLIAASGASVGFRRSLRLVPAELSAYALSIGLLTTTLGPAVAAEPTLQSALRIVAGAWLAWCALRLWREAGASFDGTPKPIGPARVFVTTLLNPKALVFAFAVFPQPPQAAHAAVFAALVGVVACGWALFGEALARTAGARLTPARIARASALVLALFASLLAGSAMAAALS
ncbi:LysE family translocator [Chthonobacter rhizosphaerae]|uniref:LysE family translocator n=1 Tax=Chthonobacter rhizosphaerae TaxID=2735553 RepID=UPI0015EEEAAC|nr:LysE family transporter [Chthonobacter rhizosphaerae]